MDIKDVDINAPRPRGRPPKTAEEKAAAPAAKKEYARKYRAEHKARAAACKQQSMARAVAAKKFYCAACDKTFTNSTNLKYHLMLSVAHRNRDGQQPAAPAPAAQAGAIEAH